MVLSLEQKQFNKELRKQEKWSKEHKIINGQGYKICNCHNEYFPDESPWLPATTEYYYKNDKNSLDGLYSRCKECEKKKSMDWKRNNPFQRKQNDKKDNNSINGKNRKRKCEQKEAEQQRLEQERLAREQAKENEKQRKIEFNIWINEQIANYNSPEKVELLKQIRLDEIGEFSERSIRLLVLIDNIDDYFCREELKSWLHSGNPTSKKVFYHITGIKLPSTNKGTYEILNNITKSQYKGIVPYKKRQKHEKDIQTFYRNIRVPVPHFEEIQAEAYNKFGLNMFITNFEDCWQISEARSGLRIVNGITKKQVFEELKKMIDKHGAEKFQEQINKAIEMYGESPKYKQEVMV
jgi:hypothetical protein